MTTKAELEAKYKTSKTFQNEMKRAQDNYRVFWQRAFYSQIDPPTQNFITKFDGKSINDFDIYFVYGAFQHIRAPSLDKLTINFVTRLPKPIKQYILVYFNDENSNYFSDLKTAFQLMPIEYWLNLNRIILMKPSLSQKASRFFVFGTIPKFINAHIEYAETIGELCELAAIKEQAVLKFLPNVVRQPYAAELKEKKKNQLTFSEPNPMSHIIKPRSIIKKIQIDEYDKSQNGLPEMLQVLIYYFKQHPQGLSEVGIFRKSANIEQQIQYYQRLAQKNYGCLVGIQNPHLIANLIKKFLAHLLTPIIPFDIFYDIMNQPNLTAEFLAKKMKQVANTNLTKVLTLMFLIQFLLTSVISKADINKMTAENVAICFAPCIMWAKELTAKEIIYAKKSVQALLIMITKSEEVFGNKKNQNKLYRSSFFLRRKNSFDKMANALSNESSQKVGSNQYHIKHSATEAQESSQSDYQTYDDVKLTLQSKYQPIKQTPHQQVGYVSLGNIQYKNENREHDNLQVNATSVIKSKVEYFNESDQKKKGLLTSKMLKSQKQKQELTVPQEIKKLRSL